LLHPNLDIIPGPMVDIVHDLSVFPWPLASDCYDAVVSRNVIEHIEWRKSSDFIKEIFRILKNGGKTIIFTTNLYERCKLVVETGVDIAANENIYGSQEFINHCGCHKSGYSETYIRKLFEDATFNHITVIPHPSSKYDLVVEAFKMNEDIFERSYFEDGLTGYKEFRDFATHHDTAERILAVEPPVKSFLDCGGARGYLCRILENKGIPSTCMDISKYCQKTRATDSFILHDATKIPWSFKDKQFDLCFSMNFLEHLKPEILDSVIREMERVSVRGFHGIHMTDCPFKEMDKDIDLTHHINENKAWWTARFNAVVPSYSVFIDHPRNIEYSRPELQPPISLAPATPDNLLKINLGSYKDMFYYGWLNCDILDLTEFASSQAYSFIHMDATKPFPWKDEAVDLVFTSHLIEHFTRDEGRGFLKECYRVMKPGGVIRISVPNTRLITKDYLEGNITEYRYVNVGVERATDDAEAYYELLLRNHKTVYDEASLSKMLQEIGFKNVTHVSAFESHSIAMKTQTVNTFCDLSLVLEASR
jgi:predicted SAM-dependent methyltransferase